MGPEEFKGDRLELEWPSFQKLNRLHRQIPTDTPGNMNQPTNSNNNNKKTIFSTGEEKLENYSGQFLHSYARGPRDLNINQLICVCVWRGLSILNKPDTESLPSRKLPECSLPVNDEGRLAGLISIKFSLSTLIASTGLGQALDPG